MRGNIVIGTWMLFAAAVLCGCGSEGEVGESCSEEGADGECVDGSVCGKPDDGDTLECLTQCIEQADCPSDQECNGVSGSSLKGCRPKTK